MAERKILTRIAEIGVSRKRVVAMGLDYTGQFLLVDTPTSCRFARYKIGGLEDI
jgi:hypothetical protein